jgi:hypothetical protein
VDQRVQDQRFLSGEEPVLPPDPHAHPGLDVRIVRSGTGTAQARPRVTLGLQQLRQPAELKFDQRRGFLLHADVTAVAQAVLPPPAAFLRPLPQLQIRRPFPGCQPVELQHRAGLVIARQLAVLDPAEFLQCQMQSAAGFVLRHAGLLT